MVHGKHKKVKVAHEAMAEFVTDTLSSVINYWINYLFLLGVEEVLKEWKKWKK